MFFYITLHKINVLALSDHPADPFNRSIELYQTWHLSALDPSSPASGLRGNWARQGFSVRGAPDDGTSFRRESITVVDPQVTFGFEDAALQRGMQTRYRFDAHYWESDGSSEKVRSIFSDGTLQYLRRVWEVAKENDQRAKQSLSQWLDENWKKIAMSLVGAASPAALGVVTRFNVLPLLDILVETAKSNGDDYHQMHRFVFETVGTGGSLRWRVISPSLTPGWLEGPGTQRIVERVRDSNGQNQYDVEWRFRVID